MNTRPGFDTSPLLDREFAKVSQAYIKDIAPDQTKSDPEAIPELLVHMVKRVPKVPTVSMVQAAVQRTQISTKQILEIWDAMWERV